METYEIVHSGVKGMRWGVRRYQNKDGSLTAAGRKRYGSSKEEAMKARAKAKAKAEKANAKAAKKAEKDGKKLMRKSVKDMTDEELNKAINRARLEQEYNRMHPEPVSRGKKIAQTLMKDVITPAAVNAGKKYLDNVLGKYIDDAFKDPNSYAALKAKYDKMKIKKDIEDLKNPKESLEDAVKRMQNERKLKTLMDLDAKDAAEARKQQGQYEAYNKTDEASAADKSGQYRSGPKSKTSSNDSTNSSYRRLLPGSKEDSKVHSGTVMGEGTSSSKTKARAESGSKWWKSSDVKDADWWSAEPAKAANTDQARLGQSYVQQFLLPAPKDD